MTDVIYDGNSLYARAWYATCHDYIDVDAAIRSALQTVFSLMNRDAQRLNKQIDRTLFCWDGLHGRDKGDKRQEKPPEYHEGKQSFQELSTFLIGAAHAQHPTSEADDTVATAVEQSKADEIVVASGDKDLMQLQCDSVHYFCLNTKSLLSRPFINGKFGVKNPCQIALAQAVIGDRVDNIPGIKGWGMAKVKMLFERVTPQMNIEEALDVIEPQIPEKHLKAFYASLDRTLLNRTLKGIPAPAPLRLATFEEMLECNLPGLEDAYGRMLDSFVGKRPAAAVSVGMEENDY